MFVVRTGIFSTVTFESELLMQIKHHACVYDNDTKDNFS